MSLTTSEMTPADIAALTRSNDDSFGGGAWWVIILFLFYGMFGWGGFGGFGGFGGGMNGGVGSEVQRGFDHSSVISKLDGITQGICDSTYALNNAITNGFNNTNVAVMQGFGNLSSQLANCCCETQRAIDGVNYNMATNTCAIQNTVQNSTRDIIENQNAGTRAILDYLCQDKISTLQAENQSLRLAASQQAQNAYIAANQEAQTAELIRRLGADRPIPAYVVPNPNCCYGTPVGVLNSGCGCN